MTLATTTSVFGQRQKMAAWQEMIRWQVFLFRKQKFCVSTFAMADTKQ
jgi:hypothetical protein